MPFDTTARNEIKNPGKEFSQFLEQYFDQSLYCVRGEQDPSLPEKLKGEERETAKKYSWRISQAMTKGCFISWTPPGE